MNNEFLAKLEKSFDKQKSLTNRMSLLVNDYFEKEKVLVEPPKSQNIIFKDAEVKDVFPVSVGKTLETFKTSPIEETVLTIKHKDEHFENTSFFGKARHASSDNISEDLLSDSIDDLISLQESIDDIVLGENGGSDNELNRHLHSLKGVFGMLGSKRGFELIHAMESANGKPNSQSFIKEAWLIVYQLIDALKKNENIPVIEPLKYASDWMSADWVDSNSIILDEPQEIESKFIEKQDEPLSVIPTKIISKTIETRKHVGDDSRISLSANTLEFWSEQVRIARQSQDATGLTVHSIVDKLDEMDDGIRKMGSMLRELEWHADSHLQARSRRHDKENFDPLEMDRFTRLQELTRQVSEGSDDIQEIRQDIIKSFALLDEWRAKQGLSLSELDKGMAETRLKPMDSIKTRLLRSVRVAAEYVGVEVNFKLLDNGVEIDRTLLDKILTPLEHMLRNSVAHGIEKPDVRIKAGKDPVGQITLECSQQAGHLIWVLSDDGAGVNLEKVKNKAVELGIIKKDETLSMKDAIELISKPSFSTATVVNDMSGRGVGMDVVRNDVVSMGGRFMMDSIPNKGTTTTIIVPSSSYSIPSLVIKAGLKSYAIPNEIVSDFWLIKQSEFVEIVASGQVERNKNTYKVKTIYDLLSLEGHISTKARNVYAVLVRDGDETLVLIVDRMVGIFDLTMLPLGDFWTTAPWIVGSVLLQDGVATFLINPLSMSGLKYDITNKNNDFEPSSPSKKEITILVVDDSLTVRKSTSRILKLSGYNVLTAKDGKEGFEMFSINEPDLVITDVEMPRMDGFELLRSIRQGVKMPETPVIIITSRTAQRHRNHAETLKANAYLGKPFKDDELLDNIKGFLK